LQFLHDYISLACNKLCGIFNSLVAAANLLPTFGFFVLQKEKFYVLEFKFYWSTFLLSPATGGSASAQKLASLSSMCFRFCFAVRSGDFLSRPFALFRFSKPNTTPLQPTQRKIQCNVCNFFGSFRDPGNICLIYELLAVAVVPDRKTLLIQCVP